jgi:hypothetical protein
MNKYNQVGTYFGDISYPKSEKTIINNKYWYKGLHYINDMGKGEEYRIEKDGKSLGVMVKYYRGKLLAEYKIIK